MRLALQALERPKLEPFVPAKTAKQPFPITTYCTLSALGSQAGLPYLSVGPVRSGPGSHPAMAANARAMAARPTAHLPMLLQGTHILGRMCVLRVCRYRHRRKHPRYPTLYSALLASFSMRVFPLPVPSLVPD